MSVRNSGLHGPPPRRIAIIEAARPQRARMGSIGDTNPSMGRGAPGWTTLSDDAPDSSANFLSSVIQAQNNARTITPGLLSYTPASATPMQNIAPWNSWLQPNCGPGGNAPTGPDGTVSAENQPTPSASPLWVALGILGAAASLKYLFKGQGR